MFDESPEISSPNTEPTTKPSKPKSALLNAVTAISLAAVTLPTASTTEISAAVRGSLLEAVPQTSLSAARTEPAAQRLISELQTELAEGLADLEKRGELAAETKSLIETSISDLNRPEATDAVDLAVIHIYSDVGKSLIKGQNAAWDHRDQIIEAFGQLEDRGEVPEAVVSGVELITDTLNGPGASGSPVGLAVTASHAHYGKKLIAAQHAAWDQRDQILEAFGALQCRGEVSKELKVSVARTLNHLKGTASSLDLALPVAVASYAKSSIAGQSAAWDHREQLIESYNELEKRGEVSSSVASDIQLAVDSLHGVGATGSSEGLAVTASKAQYGEKLITAQHAAWDQRDLIVESFEQLQTRGQISSELQEVVDLSLNSLETTASSLDLALPVAIGNIAKKAIADQERVWDKRDESLTK